ncbi:uncharacterized protein LOC113462041 [Phoenix dactylifera]|uniref:Uncharacterized protein LOC113462041 n=1 Tax=Phoenix dactylifera TaxID=42345 RepID=A0A8B8ZIK6_PHODC|nr:uncharacterized protein LOC113462041 [Phoenix dactylifera]
MVNRKKSEKTLFVPVVGEAVNDTLLVVVKSEGKCSAGKYLIYTRRDRCKPMNHHLWRFLSALGEAQYLNRALVMDLSICLNSTYTSMDQDEEGKDFLFCVDFEHLRDSASVVDERQFWKVTPKMLAEVKDAHITGTTGTRCWYTETQSLNNGIPVVFDGYMRVEVDTEVLLRGKMQIETVNDLTNCCKDGINTCHMDS